jgi:hypothetical protein
VEYALTVLDTRQATLHSLWLGETVKVRKQNSPLSGGPFTKEALTSAKPLIKVSSKST